MTNRQLTMNKIKIISIISQIITILVVLVMRKRIALVVQLFKEAGKAVYFMPALFLQPIYVCLLNTKALNEFGS